MRLFIAIDCPESLRLKIQTCARNAAQALADVRRRLRWVNDSQLHLTLKFLGETPEEQLKGLAARLERVAERYEPFSISLGHLGGFGGRDHLRVLWLGVQEGAETAAKLAESIEAASEELGFARENRHFHPHITLARCKTGDCRINLEGLPPTLREAAVGSFVADHLSLIRSRLTPEGPCYEILKRFPLKASK